MTETLPQLMFMILFQTAGNARGHYLKRKAASPLLCSMAKFMCSAANGSHPGGNGGVFSETWEYNPRTDKWRGVAAMPHPRHGLGAVSIGNAIYVLGRRLTSWRRWHLGASGAV